MPEVIMRNNATGETAPVDTLSDEYREKLDERYDHQGSPKPLWEVTGEHHEQRLNQGNVQETDHGYEDKPLNEGIDPTIITKPEEHPERALTDAEREAGIESYEQKLKELEGEGDAPTPAQQLDNEPDPAKRKERAEKRVGRKSGKGKRQRSSSSSSGSSGSSGSGGSSGSSGSGGSDS